MRFIGIDPGVAGGLAVLYEDGSISEAVKMPRSALAILHFLHKHGGDEFGGCRAALEYVRSSPQMGVVSAFTFGRGVGALEMAIVAASIPYYEVTPARWQKLLDCRTGGDKNITKARAAELWPGMKITHAIADALLIAEWCRRKHVNTVRTT